MASVKILQLSIPDNLSLYKCYMPFVSGGGLFLPTEMHCAMDDELLIVLELCNEEVEFAVSAKVVWITPAAAQNQRAQGVGLQFAENGEQLKIRIEGLLSGNFEKANSTLFL